MAEIIDSETELSPLVKIDYNKDLDKIPYEVLSLNIVPNEDKTKFQTYLVSNFPSNNIIKVADSYSNIQEALVGTYNILGDLAKTISDKLDEINQQMLELAASDDEKTD